MKACCGSGCCCVCWGEAEEAVGGVMRGRRRRRYRRGAATAFRRCCCGGLCRNVLLFQPSLSWLPSSSARGIFRRNSIGVPAALSLPRHEVNRLDWDGAHATPTTTCDRAAVVLPLHPRHRKAAGR